MKPRSMLVSDPFCSHMTNWVKKAVANAECDLVVIPAGMTSMLQLVNLSLNKPFN